MLGLVSMVVVMLAIITAASTWWCDSVRVLLLTALNRTCLLTGIMQATVASILGGPVT